MQDGNQQEPGWVFKPGDQTKEPKDETPDVGVLAVAASSTDDTPEQTDAARDLETLSSQSPQVEWTASEYIANPKTAGWFMLLAVVSVITAAVIYLVTRDYVSTGVVIILGVILGIFAARQPRVLRYTIDNRGVHIGEKFYPYNIFKSFTLADNQPIHHISLTPLKRFMPPLVIHYDPQDEDKIANTLADYLPFEEFKRDVVDSLTRRLRL